MDPHCRTYPNMTGSFQSSTDCDVNAFGGQNRGCGIFGKEGTYGEPLNARGKRQRSVLLLPCSAHRQSITVCTWHVLIANRSPCGGGGAGGGTIATQWLERSITVWFFPRGQEPADLHGEHPQPETWGVPHAAFPLEANCASTHFEDLQLVFDTTFCGGFAGGNAYSETCHDAPLPCRDALVGDATAGEHSPREGRRPHQWPMALCLQGSTAAGATTTWRSCAGGCRRARWGRASTAAASPAGAPTLRSRRCSLPVASR